MSSYAKISQPFLALQNIGLELAFPPDGFVQPFWKHRILFNDLADFRGRVLQTHWFQMNNCLFWSCYLHATTVLISCNLKEKRGGQRDLFMDNWLNGLRQWEHSKGHKRGQFYTKIWYHKKKLTMSFSSLATRANLSSWFSRLSSSMMSSRKTSSSFLSWLWARDIFRANSSLSLLSRFIMWLLKWRPGKKIHFGSQLNLVSPKRWLDNFGKLFFF